MRRMTTDENKRLGSCDDAHAPGGFKWRSPEPADFPNHHRHNFYVSERTFESAVAMGYRARAVEWQCKL